MVSTPGPPVELRRTGGAPTVAAPAPSALAAAGVRPSTAVRIPQPRLRTGGCAGWAGLFRPRYRTAQPPTPNRTPRRPSRHGRPAGVDGAGGAAGSRRVARDPRRALTRSWPLQVRGVAVPGLLPRRGPHRSSRWIGCAVRPVAGWVSAGRPVGQRVSAHSPGPADGASRPPTGR